MLTFFPKKAFFYRFILLILLPFRFYADENPLLVGQLSNGLTYYIHHDPFAQKHISLDFIVKVGSMDEQEDERGFSHLIEHAIANEIQFKGKKISDPRCGIWDLSLPNIEALTSYEFTQYHFDISLAIPYALEEIFLGFYNQLFHLPLDQKNLQVAKRELLEEIVERKSSPIETWKQARIAQEYPPYQYRHPLGSQESVSRATLVKVDHFFKKHYQPQRLALIVISPVDPQEIRSLIAKYFEGLSSSSNKEPRPKKIDTSQETGVYINKGLKTTYLSLSKQLPRMSQRDSLLFSMLTQMLRERLQTYAATHQEPFSNPFLEMSTYPALLRLTVSLTEDPIEGIIKLSRILESFFTQLVSEEQFDRIKFQMKNHLQLLRASRDITYLSDFYRDHFLLNCFSLENDHPFLREMLLETIQIEDVHQMFRSFQGFSHVSLSTPSPEVAYLSSKLFSKLKIRSSYVD